MISITKLDTMIKQLLSLNKSIYFILLILIVLSSCYSSKQVACPEIETDHPRTRRYKRNFSLAWNHSRKIPKKSVLIIPVEENTIGDDHEDDMTLRELTGFQDLQPVRSGDLNTLMASQDATFTAPSELVVFDASVNYSQTVNPPSKQEIRETKREIRKEMKSEMKSSKSVQIHSDDSIMLFAVTSFVLGIIGIFTMPLLLGLLATIFGAIALGMIRREGVHYGKGLATAGLILGIVLMVVGIILLPFAILGIFI